MIVLAVLAAKVAREGKKKKHVAWQDGYNKDLDPNSEVNVEPDHDKKVQSPQAKAC
eukprot:CAMPEP_0170542756 /NCGR_PEP_ID=MMETSP0211-20121228/2091_1 /TAXON_ID=311385 /ORGANISM="Pseudokeronopsis sp., Strain OXSARD2" /LENGTH=55 /DNA_ID=CAMNT_0010845927 /DNA_START=282 /DNA_END=449 /DNA_ORIENTATION=+